MTSLFDDVTITKFLFFSVLDAAMLESLASCIVELLQDAGLVF